MRNAILILAAILVGVSAYASERSDKARQVFLEKQMSEPHVMWSILNGKVSYFDFSGDTVIVDSLKCAELDNDYCYCVITPTPEAAAQWRVKGLLFKIDTQAESIAGFVLLPKDN